MKLKVLDSVKYFRSQCLNLHILQRSGMSYFQISKKLFGILLSPYKFDKNQDKAFQICYINLDIIRISQMTLNTYFAPFKETNYLSIISLYV